LLQAGGQPHANGARQPDTCVIASGHNRVSTTIAAAAPPQQAPRTVKRCARVIALPCRRRRALPRAPQLAAQPPRSLHLIAHLPQGGLQVGNLGLTRRKRILQRRAGVAGRRGGEGGARLLNLPRQLRLAARRLVAHGAHLDKEQGRVKRSSTPRWVGVVEGPNCR
jgi:hypothetical protein